jgi:DNA-binding CsgD family transcriptional regulator
MKAAAVLTSQVMQQISELPGVAVLDWCDRAASALARMHHPALATVTVGQVDARCVLTSLEISGVGASVPIAERPTTEIMPRVDMQTLRDGVHEGDWIGWAFQPLTPGQYHVDSMKLGPAGQRRPASPLSMRWDAMSGGELIVGAVGLQGTVPGRVLLVEMSMLGVSAADVARNQAVMGAVLPLLGIKYVNAIGPVPADRHSWLTPREETILWKLVAGKKVPQIAMDLHRSVYTVHDHVKSLHRKLGATNRGQLVSRALGHLGPLINRTEEAQAGSLDGMYAQGASGRDGAATAGRRRSV